MGFLVENAGTIVTGLIVAAVVFLAVRSIVKGVRSGKPLCGGGCGSGACSACGGGCAQQGGECPAVKKIADKIRALDNSELSS